MRFAVNAAILCLASLSFAAEPPPLSVLAKSAIIVDGGTGFVVFAKDADTPRYPASTTKILTALIALERLDPNEIVMAPAECEQITGASLHLRAGETLSARHLIEAAMVRSANDACHALAVHIAGSEKEFAKIMNERAVSAGATRSNFITPNGLPNRLHVTTARDLACIAREAMNNGSFRDIAKKRRVTVERSINQEDRFLISKNKFLDWDPSYEGIKTGYTNDAGSSFVGAATRNGLRFITVILDSSDWKADQKAMMDWAFEHFERGPIAIRGDSMVPYYIPGVQGKQIALPTETISGVAVKGQVPQVSFEFVPKQGLLAPVKAGDNVGEVVFRNSNGWFAKSSLVATKNVDAPRFSLSSATSPAGVVLLVGLGGAAVFMKMRSRDGHRRYL